MATPYESGADGDRGTGMKRCSSNPGTLETEIHASLDRSDSVAFGKRLSHTHARTKVVLTSLWGLWHACDTHARACSPSVLPIVRCTLNILGRHTQLCRVYTGRSMAKSVCMQRNVAATTFEARSSCNNMCKWNYHCGGALLAWISENPMQRCTQRLGKWKV